MPSLPSLVPFAPTLIVSGGQTGADRGGLDAAIILGIPHNGYCPRGRRAEDGGIPDRYVLRETSDSGYEVRTERNVKHSDATIICTMGTLSGGSRLTATYADRLGKPWLLVNPFLPDASGRIATFLRERQPKILNVAGSRESKAPGIQSATMHALLASFIDAALAAASQLPSHTLNDR